MRLGLRPRIDSLILLLVCVVSWAKAQETVVSGKITDANSGDPVPFVNVVFKGTTIGTTTDFEGKFSIATYTPTDSLVASYVGYKPRTKVVKPGVAQVINFQLIEDILSLQEVVILAGENPAWEIMRNVVDNKERNDKRKFSAYEYETYTKIEIDVDNISEKFRQRRLVKKITNVLDSIDRIAGEDGKPILPLFISESVSRLYYRDDPSLKREHILKSKITGVGIEDGTLITQLIGSSFQEYNFYQNWLNIVTKNFVSPIADGWRLYYDYDLTDSLYIGNHFCYRIDFTPRSSQDLAFTGTMWITKHEFALKQIDVTVGKEANLNFIDRIKIQQELEPTTLGYWLPAKNRVLIDVGQLNDNAAGMLAKFYTSNRNFVVNQPKEISFYERPISMEEDARLNEDDKTWDTLRHDPLSETEKNVYRMIDTLNNIPTVKTYIDIIKIAINGYYNAGKVYIGPYLGFMVWNNIEGFRIQGGGYTSIDFSKKWVLAGQIGYGFNDTRMKYTASVENILSKERWTSLSFRVRRDIARIGVDEDNLADNPLFLVSTRWGTIRRGYYFDESRLNFQRELFKGFTQRISVRNWTFNPTYNFGYYENSGGATSIQESFETTEVILESRYGRDELFVQNDNQRISLGSSKWPIFTLRYTHGIKGALGSDFEYDKLRLNVTKRIRCGPLGYGNLTLTGEYTFNTLSYPLLNLHLGNQTPLYSAVNYSLMDYGEFVSDGYGSLQYRQHMEGFFFNRIPLLRKLKLREIASASIIYGGMRQSNRELIALVNGSGDQTLQAGYLEHGRPYVELGYGVENILKFLRVDFVHRITYLDNLGARSFGVLFTAQLSL